MDKQYLLRRPIPSGDEYMVTWLSYDPKVKIGSVISLEDDSTTRWEVRGVYSGVKPYTRWGLDLPKSERTER